MFLFALSKRRCFKGHRVVRNMIGDVEPADKRIPFEYYDTEVTLKDIKLIKPPVMLDDEKIGQNWMLLKIKKP